MKLVSSFLLSAVLGIGLHAQAYEPKMVLSAPPSSGQAAAINYLLLNTDETTFAHAYVSEGTKAADDEFADSTGPTLAETNQKLIADAHRYLRGEVDYPASVTLRLRRYNPANQTFLTDAVSENLNLELNNLARGEMPKGWRGARLYKLRVLNWNRLSGIKLTPELAKKLSELVGKDRTVGLQMNLRLVPGTRGIVDGMSSDCCYNATIRSFRIVGLDADIPLTPEIENGMTFGVYSRTEADAAFAAKVHNKVLVSQNDTLIFDADGTLQVGGSLNGLSSVQSKIGVVERDMTYGRWYIMQGKLLMKAARYHDDLLTQEYDEAGALRIGGIPYQEEKRIVLEGGQVKWRP